jgi:hypothetical protein
MVLTCVSLFFRIADLLLIALTAWFHTALLLLMSISVA